MADVHIDISNDESERFALYSGSIFELMIGSFSINMNADQFQQLCDNLRPWIIDDDAPAQQPAAAVPEMVGWLHEVVWEDGTNYSYHAREPNPLDPTPGLISQRIGRAAMLAALAGKEGDV